MFFLVMTHVRSEAGRVTKNIAVCPPPPDSVRPHPSLLLFTAPSCGLAAGLTLLYIAQLDSLPAGPRRSPHRAAPGDESSGRWN